jgi:ABC-type transport system substrate-binding protein
MRNVYEYLVEVDGRTGGYLPMLATEWNMRPDGKAWTVKLRKGVPWHRGFGEFTAQDIAHTYKRLTREGGLSSLVGYWRENLDRIEVVNDYEAVFHLKRAEPEWYHQVSSFWDSVLISKAQFDKEGQEGFAAKPVGTGPYLFVERKLGQGLRFERVPYTHWRVQPDFKELEFLIVREELTRQAMLLAGEAHIAEDIPPDSQPQAIARGMKVVKTTIPTGGLVGNFGGNYVPSTPSFDTTIPWTNRKVRQALNLAINRQEIIDNLFAGKYEPIVAPFAHRTHPEYKPAWEANFKQNYAYDPAKARQLLKEAGYPNGFKAIMDLHTQPGAPRQDAVAEAVANYWQKIGVDVKLETIDRALHVQQMRGYTKQGRAWVQLAVYRPPWNRFQVFNTPSGVVHGFLSEFIDQKWKELGETVDPEKRTQIQREVVDHLLDEYAHFPIVWVFGEFMINPKVVSEYVTAGISGASHLEYVKAAR